MCGRLQLFAITYYQHYRARNETRNNRYRRHRGGGRHPVDGSGGCGSATDSATAVVVAG